MTQVTEPFPIFYDDDGTPLENGMIYVGEANQDPRTNPVTVYTDEARTVPIAQPIITLNGRPAYQGAPVNLYVAAASYSVAVFNKRGTPVTYSQDATSFATSVELAAFEAELAAPSGATLVGSTQGGTGALNRSVAARINDMGIYATNYGTYQQAVNHWLTVMRDSSTFTDRPPALIFPPGDHDVGAGLTVDPLFNSVGGKIIGMGNSRLITTSGPKSITINSGSNNKIWRELTIENLTFVNGSLRMQSVDGNSINIYGFVLDNLKFEGDPAAHSMWMDGCFEGTVQNCRFSRSQSIDTPWSCQFVDSSGFGLNSSVIWVGNTTRGGRNGFRQVGFGGDCFRYGNTHLRAYEEGAYAECNGYFEYGGHYENNCATSAKDAGVQVVGGGILSGIVSISQSPYFQKYGARVFTASSDGFQLHPGLDQSDVSGHKLYFIGGSGSLPVFVQGSYDLSTAMASSGRVVSVNNAGGLAIDGTKVIGAQGAAVADATGGATVDAEARTALNTLLARLRAHGLIAT